MRPVPSPAVGDISRLSRPFQARPVLLALFSLALGLCPAVSGAADEAQSHATPTGKPLPRWAMLNKGEVNARVGPSTDHPQLFTYRQAQLPVQIISETRDWRLICDPDGRAVWVKGNLLTSPRTVLSPVGRRIELRARPKAEAPVKAILRPRAMASVEKCDKGWCKVSVGGESGWAPEDAFWGRQKTPVCQRPDPLAVR